MKMKTLSRSFRRDLVTYGMVVVMFLAIQLPKLDSVPWDQYESWRQSDTYSIAVNYVQYGMDLLHPQLNYDGVSENYAQLELQIVPYLSALVFQLTGTMTPVVPRSRRLTQWKLPWPR